MMSLKKLRTNNSELSKPLDISRKFISNNFKPLYGFNLSVKWVLVIAVVVKNVCRQDYCKKYLYK